MCGVGFDGRYAILITVKNERNPILHPHSYLGTNIEKPNRYSFNETPESGFIRDAGSSAPSLAAYKNKRVMHILIHMSPGTYPGGGY
jgi:hypothetical protein